MLHTNVEVLVWKPQRLEVLGSTERLTALDFSALSGEPDMIRLMLDWAHSGVYDGLFSLR